MGVTVEAAPTHVSFHWELTELTELTINHYIKKQLTIYIYVCMLLLFLNIIVNRLIWLILPHFSSVLLDYLAEVCCANTLAFSELRLCHSFFLCFQPSS